MKFDVTEVGRPELIDEIERLERELAELREQYEAGRQECVQYKDALDKLRRCYGSNMEISV